MDFSTGKKDELPFKILESLNTGVVVRGGRIVG